MTKQRGGFALGLIVGLLVGLALALAVALYVTKVPIPFVNKVPQRTAQQEALEVERNKQWDPNAPLSGKPAQRAPGTAPQAAATPPAATAPGALPPGIAPAPPGTVVLRPPAVRDPGAILSGEAPADRTARSAPPGSEPFNYFVQAGAFARAEDAEQQRARLAMLGFTARVSEREQAGRTVFRVRLGPYTTKDEADSAQNRLQGSGIDASLVRVER
jgi:cell division protein FtsN